MLPAVAGALLAITLSHTGDYPWTHVRTLALDARALVLQATARSPLVRALADALEESDVFAYVVVEDQPDFDDRGGSIVLLGAADQARFLQIRISAWTSSLDDRIAMLGHELRHAMEVAGAPEVRDAASVSALFKRIGWGYGSGQFETDAAREAEAQIREELMEGEK